MYNYVYLYTDIKMHNLQSALMKINNYNYNYDKGWGEHEWSFLYAYKPYMNKLIEEYK